MDNTSKPFTPVSPTRDLENSPPYVRVIFGNFRVGNDEVVRCVEPFVTRVERSPLCRLRSLTLPIEGGTFENIDFWGRPAHERSVVMHGSRVFLTGTGATRQPLTREIRKVTQVIFITWIGGDVRYAVQGLVGDSSDIACVIGVWPL